jgi:murein DD-endopeptidase MepM/ murein hydrolase activator NlpD
VTEHLVIMGCVSPRLIALLLVAGALAAAATGASEPSQPAVVSASAYGISITVPGQPFSVAAESVAPGTTTTGVADGFVFPADGSLVRTGALSSSVSSRATGAAGAQAVSDVTAITLFNGEVTADSVAGRAKASSAGADADGSLVTNLVVFGTLVSATPNLRTALGDWGYLVALEEVAEAPVAEGIRDARGAVNALHVVLTADHAGLPAGTEIILGHAEAAASMQTETPEAPAPTTPRSKPPAARPKPTETAPKPKVPRVVPGLGGPLFVAPPQNISAPLSPKGYVFPVFGEASFGDTWGAPRATTGRHQGTDIFAPLGAPILAVADGTVFSVGWNAIGGWRLWLRDRQGNQFYYAHLAAYSPLARNGAEVEAGQVIAYNGNSGDAQGTPFHLHFEIHPVGLLPLGYKGGAVNPFDYLSAWRRVEDVSFAAGSGWAPPVPSNATAPRPAAILLGSTDISSASGLDPGALDRALAAPVSAGDSVLDAG